MSAVRGHSKESVGAARVLDMQPVLRKLQRGSRRVVQLGISVAVALNSTGLVELLTYSKWNILVEKWGRRCKCRPRMRLRARQNSTTLRTSTRYRNGGKPGGGLQPYISQRLNEIGYLSAARAKGYNAGAARCRPGGHGLNAVAACTYLSSPPTLPRKVALTI